MSSLNKLLSVRYFDGFVRKTTKSWVASFPCVSWFTWNQSLIFCALTEITLTITVRKSHRRRQQVWKMNARRLHERKNLNLLSLKGFFRQIDRFYAPRLDRGTPVLLNKQIHDNSNHNNDDDDNNRFTCRNTPIWAQVWFGFSSTHEISREQLLLPEIVAGLKSNAAQADQYTYILVPHLS